MKAREIKINNIDLKKLKRKGGLRKVREKRVGLKTLREGKDYLALHLCLSYSNVPVVVLAILQHGLQSVLSLGVHGCV